MVSPSKPNHSRVANDRDKCKLVKGSKPLINFKFYLDIEKHNISTLIENKIKEFGGSIEFFLIQEVTHFVTDKLLDDINDEHNSIPAQSPLTSSINDLSSITVSPIQNINFNTNDTKGTTTRHQSRANAMLHRARLTNQQQQTNYNKISTTTTTLSTTNTINIAKKFGTTIWSSDYTLKFLNKINKFILNNNNNNNNDQDQLIVNNNLINNKLKQIELIKPRHHHQNHHNNTKILKGNFIKIESFNKQYRPIYREFLNWPEINLNTDYSSGPFDLKQQEQQPQQQNIINNKIMTRKGRPKKKIPEQKQLDNNKLQHQDKDEKQSNITTNTTNTTNTTTNNDLTTNSKCGYCELCHVEYDILKIHLKTDVHRNFAKNDINFISLDRLIKNGANVEQFIKLNTTTTSDSITSSPTTNSKIKQTQQQQTPQKSPSKQQSPPIVHVFGKRTITKQQQQQQHKTNILIKTNGKIINYADCLKNEIINNTNCVIDANKIKNDNSIVTTITTNTTPSVTLSSQTTTTTTTTTIANNKRRISGSGSGGNNASVNKSGHSVDNNQIKQNSSNETTIKTEEQLISKTTKRSNNSVNSSNKKSNSSKRSSSTNCKKRRRLNNSNSNNNKQIKLTINKRRRKRKCINNHLNLNDNNVNNLIINDELNKNEQLLSKTKETIDNNKITNKLRSRRESCKKINYDETKEDDENNIIKTIIPNKRIIATATRTTIKTSTISNKEKNSIDNETTSKTLKKMVSPIKINSTSSQDAIKCKQIKIRGGIRWRGPSPEERPPSKVIPMVYKVIDDLNNSNNDKTDIKIKLSNLTDTKNRNQLNHNNDLKPKNKQNDELIKNCSNNFDKNNQKLQTTTTNGLIVKFKRVRQSELSLLSDEAENFMFPKRELSDIDTDDDRQSTSEPADISNDIVSSDLIDSTDMKLESENDSRRQFNKQHHHNNHPDTRKKRRTQMESFLNDNSDYYKFENPGSRLRFQDTPTQPILIQTIKLEGVNDNTISNDNNVEVNQEDRVGGITWNTLKSQNIQKHKFSFERVPNNEPWYLAFQRQDEGKEKIFEYYGSTAYRKLPFEMGPLPPLSSNCCILNQINQPIEIVQTETATKTNSSQFQSKVIKEELIKEELDDEIIDEIMVNTLINGDVVGDNDDEDLDDDIDDDEDDDDDDDDDDDGDTNSITTIRRNKKIKSISLKKTKQLLDACHPRKSPREHASTLAILSSIVNQKRKRNKGSISSIGDIISEDNNSRNSLLIDYEQNLSPCPEDETMTEENNIKNKTNEKNLIMPIINENVNIIKKTNTTDYINMNVLSREIDQYFNIINLTENDSDNDDIIINNTDERYDLDFKTNSISDSLLQQPLEQDEYNTLYGNTSSLTDDDIFRISLPKNRKLTTSESLHLARNARKRKNNRTGWPNKKRVIQQTKKERESNLDNHNSIDKNLLLKEEIINEHSNDEQQENIEENLTIDLSSFIKESTDEIFITETKNSQQKKLQSQQHYHHQHNHHHNNHLRQKLNCTSNKQTTSISGIGTPINTTNNTVDYPNCINLFASSSDKAENSDMFTVSSDSLDSALTNITDIKLEKDTVHDDDELVEEEEEYQTDNLFISDDSSIDNELTTINDNKKNSVNKLKSTNVGTKLNNNKKIDLTPSTEKSNLIGSTKILTTPTKFITSQQFKRMGSGIIDSSGISIDSDSIHYQPLVCVEKIDEELMMNKYGLRSTKIQNINKKTSDKLSPKIKIEKISPHTSPQQYSPRKLRKPRGRWYRER